MSSLTDLKKSQRQNSIKRVNITRIAYMYLMWLSLVARCLKETTANIPQKSNEQRQKNTKINVHWKITSLLLINCSFLGTRMPSESEPRHWVTWSPTNAWILVTGFWLTNGNDRVTSTGETSSSTTRTYTLNNIYSLWFISLYITCIVGCILAKIPTIQSWIPQTLYTVNLCFFLVPAS